MLYFDYDRQAWIRDGIVQRCGHPDAMRCGCYGREHAGERIHDRVSLEGGRPSVNHTDDATVGGPLWKRTR